MITIHLIKKIKKYKDLDYRLAFRELYLAYQNSKHWKEVVKEVRARDNNRCVDCGKSEGRLTIHHSDYDNWGIGDSREAGDCVLVCEKCHNKRHRDNSVNVPFWANRNGELSRKEEEEIKEVINGFGI